MSSIKVDKVFLVIFVKFGGRTARLYYAGTWLIVGLISLSREQQFCAVIIYLSDVCIFLTSLKEQSKDKIFTLGKLCGCITKLYRKFNLKSGVDRLTDFGEIIIHSKKEFCKLFGNQK